MKFHRHGNYNPIAIERQDEAEFNGRSEEKTVGLF